MFRHMLDQPPSPNNMENLVKWGLRQWRQVRGNAKWDATKSAGVLAVVALGSIVAFLREGPAVQVWGLMVMVSITFLIFLFFDSKFGKMASLSLGLAAVVLGVCAVISFDQRRRQSGAPLVNSISSTIDTRGSTGSTIQNMIGSPNAVQKLTIGDVVTYRPPTNSLIDQLSKSLIEFKSKYSALSPRAFAEIEQGSTQRYKVGQTLGNILASLGLGGFDDQVFVGVARQHSMTIWYSGSNREMANDFLKAVAPYVSADDVDIYQDDRRFQSPGVILYINGLPNFDENGHVTVR
jgi:hypothetical protein